MRKILMTSVATVAMLTAVNAQQFSGDAVKIGVLTDLSGVYADFGGQGAVGRVVDPAQANARTTHHPVRGEVEGHGRRGDGEGVGLAVAHLDVGGPLSV